MPIAQKTQISHKDMSISHFIGLIKLVQEWMTAHGGYYPATLSFSHVRVYKDNHAFVLATHHDWYLESYSKGFQNIIPGYDYFDAGLKRFIWRDHHTYLRDRADTLAIASKHINIETALTLHIKTDEYSDRFILADSAKKNELLTMMVNNPETLDELINNYYQRAAHLITEADKHKFTIANPLEQSIKDTKSHFPAESMNIYLSHALKQPVKLNQREYLFLILSLYGMKAKSIGERFHLSSRTVENNLQMARSKLNCSSVAEVFALFHQSGVFNLYLQPILEEIVANT